MTDIEHRLAQELRRRAAMLDVSAPPLDAIDRAPSRSARGGWLVAALATAVAVLAVVGTVVVSGDGPPPTSPPVASTLPASPAEWGTRGSLREDSAFLAAARNRVAEETRASIGSAQAVVWFAGDTPAGRVVVGATGLGTQREGTRSEVLVLAGPPGAAIADLTAVGGAGEPADGPVSRLIQHDGRWWLFTLASPEVDAAEVSWFPRYGPPGRLPRVWQETPAANGVLVAEAPGRAVAARLRLLRDRQVVTDQSVLEDSDNLNDPSFFPVELDMSTPLRTDVDVRGADRETVTWLVNQVGIATGVEVPEMAVTVRWARTDAAGARVLATLELPGGGTIVGYATRVSADGTPVWTIDLMPVPVRELSQLTFAHVAREPDGTGQPGRLEVIAPDAPGGHVQVQASGQPVGEGTLDATGHGELDYRSGADLAVVVRAANGGEVGSARLGSDEQTDPFDLRD